MESKKRRNFTSEEKVCILKSHFLEKRQVSNICDEKGVHPTLFYRWQQEFFEKSRFIFSQEKGKESAQAKKRILALERKLAIKNEILSELMEEHVALKKRLGAI